MLKMLISVVVSAIVIIVSIVTTCLFSPIVAIPGLAIGGFSLYHARSVEQDLEAALTSQGVFQHLTIADSAKASFVCKGGWYQVALTRGGTTTVFQPKLACSTFMTLSPAVDIQWNQGKVEAHVPFKSGIPTGMSLNAKITELPVLWSVLQYLYLPNDVNANAPVKVDANGDVVQNNVTLKALVNLLAENQAKVAKWKASNQKVLQPATSTSDLTKVLTSE